MIEERERSALCSFIVHCPVPTLRLCAAAAVADELMLTLSHIEFIMGQSEQPMVDPTGCGSCAHPLSLSLTRACPPPCLPACLHPMPRMSVTLSWKT